jgi:photosystem II stability/assembly factor-like uncharacterized protein
MVIDPVRPSNLFVGLGGGSGVFKSTDGGETWFYSGTGLPLASIHGLAIDPIRPDILYAATAGGLFKSINSGETWSESGSGLSPGAVNFIAVHPVTPATLYAGTVEGLFRSSNGGEEWNPFPVTGVSAPVLFAAGDPAGPGTLFVATEDGLYQTADGGKNWNLLDNGLPRSGLHHVIIKPDRPGTIFAGTSEGIFKSTDGGKNWSSLNTGLASRDVRYLAMDPFHRERIYAGSEGGGVFVLDLTSPFSLSDPPDGMVVDSCSYYRPPTFRWDTDLTFKTIDILFSDTTDFSTRPEKIRGTPAMSEITPKTAAWKKILLLPGGSGGPVYWKGIGKTKEGSLESNVSSISVLGPEPAGNPVLSPTRKGSLPVLSWENPCHVKFKVWFGKDTLFTKKVGFTFQNKTKNGREGVYHKELTANQWSSIRKLVQDQTGAPLHWYVESWDGMGRSAKTGIMSFLLSD